MMRAFLLLVVLTMTGAACGPELDDGYQFGDLSLMTLHSLRDISERRERYCAYTGSDRKRYVLRQAAVLAIRAYVPGYPVDGICTEEFDELFRVLQQKCEQCEGR